MKRLLVLAAAAVTLFSVNAQTYPGSKPISFVVPFAAGGPTDRVARDLAEAMRKSMGNGANFVVENVNGAGGTIGANKVAKAAPDGHTLLLHHIGMAAAPGLYRKLQYKPLEDFEYLGLINEVPMTLIGKPQLEANTYRDLENYIRANGGKLNIAHASYITVNISSPNTKNLRDLQAQDALDELLSALKTRQSELANTHGRYVPKTLKIAPDLDESQIQSIADLLKLHQFDAVIATNTTLDKTVTQAYKHGNEAGGLSGAPVREKSTQVLHALNRLLNGEVPIIGVGGIMSGKDAQAKIDAGASLVQVYTGLIYQGPDLVKDCAQALARSR